MATSAEEGSSSLQNLICPLCLDVFEDATLLTCGHTFCRKCLIKYDETHQDKDHLVCPLCRSVTKLEGSRVKGLQTNVTVNGLVEDLDSSQGGLASFLEPRVKKCSACESSRDAVSFCVTCNNYMCEQCLGGHEQLTSFFKGHRIVSMQEIESGAASVSQELDKCSEHRLENKDMFCEECQTYICFKCVIVGHRDHKISNQKDFRKGLMQKVNDLIKQSNVQKKELEKNIKKSEELRQEVHATVKKLETEVKEVFREKTSSLEKNKQLLLENLQQLRQEFNDDIEVLKGKDRQRIKCIDSSTSLVAHDRLGNLESDNLSAHAMICDELKGMLQEDVDDIAAEIVSVKAKHQRFRRADNSVLDMGKIGERELEIAGEVRLKGQMIGLTSVSENEVAVAYSGSCYVYVIDSTGNIKNLINSDNQGHTCKDVNKHGGVAFVITLSESKYALYSLDGKKMSTKKFPNPGKGACPCISSSEDNIVVANKSNNISVININDELKCSITTTDKPMQAFEVGEDIIIASTGNEQPGRLTAYDKNGKVGDTLTARDGETLYAAADSQGTVYVANVCSLLKRVVITQYKVQNVKFKKFFEYKALELTLESAWCYLVSLSDNMLAFACSKRLYFIKIQP